MVGDPGSVFSWLCHPVFRLEPGAEHEWEMMAASLSISQTPVSSYQAGAIVGVNHRTPWSGELDAKRRPEQSRGGDEFPSLEKKIRSSCILVTCPVSRGLHHIVYAADEEGRRRCELPPQTFVSNV